MAGKGKDDLKCLFVGRYRVLLNDGQAMTSFCLLSARLNHLIHRLANFSIVKITDYFMTDIGARKILVILELEFITSGQLVGVKLGNPVRMGSDGKVEQQASMSRGEPEKRPEPDDDLQEALDQLSDLQI